MAETDERTRDSLPRAELERRWAATREAMAEAKLDALIAQGANALTGGGGYFRWLTGTIPLGTYPQTIVFPADGPMTIVHHGAFDADAALDPAGPEAPGVGRRLTTPSFPAVGYTQGYDAELAARAVTEGGHRRVGLLGDFMMYHGFARRLAERLSGVALTDASDMLDRIKAVKSPGDIALIRRAAAMQDEILARTRDQVQPGKKDFEVLSYSDYVGRLLGSQTGYFLGSSAPPGTPAHLRLSPQQGREMRDGDVFIWQAENSGPGGFFVHMARIFVLGKAPQALVDAFGAAVEAQNFTIGLLKPGAACREIFAAYNAYMQERGFAAERRLHCHGQGYENVERPLVRHDEPMAIAGDMNIGCHPGVANSGAFATVCDNFLTHADGTVERLHKTPQEIIEL